MFIYNTLQLKDNNLKINTKTPTLVNLLTTLKT